MGKSFAIRVNEIGIFSKVASDVVQHDMSRVERAIEIRIVFVAVPPHPKMIAGASPNGRPRIRVIVVAG